MGKFEENADFTEVKKIEVGVGKRTNKNNCKTKKVYYKTLFGIIFGYLSKSLKLSAKTESNCQKV